MINKEEVIRLAMYKGYKLIFKDCINDKAGVEKLQEVELYLIQRWLRESKGLHVEVNIYYDSEKEYMTGWMVKVYDIQDKKYPDLPYWNELEHFYSFEEAFNFGLITALEYVKQ